MLLDRSFDFLGGYCLLPNGFYWLLLVNGRYHSLLLVPTFSLNEVAGLRTATLLKKRLWHRCFPVNFAKFLRTPFLIEHLRWLLLDISKHLDTRDVECDYDTDSDDEDGLEYDEDDFD